jgi:hypothetical protein
MDMSKLSEADLKAISNNNFKGVSTEGLKILAGSADTQPEQQKLDWAEVPAESLSNLVPSTLNALDNTAKAIMSPVKTAKSALNIAIGGLQHLLPSSVNELMHHANPETINNPAKFDAFINDYKNTYGTEEGFKDALAHDPARVLMDASGLLMGGGGLASKIPALEKAGNIAMTAGKAINPVYAPTKAVVSGMSGTGAAVADHFLGAHKVLGKELKGLSVPRVAPSQLPPNADLSFGPPVPRFGYSGIEKPTAGMLTEDPAILRLEMNARNRAPMGFYQRDIANNTGIFNQLKDNALNDKSANQLQDALNAKTGPMRDAAFSAAEANPIFKDIFQKYIEDKAQEPGIRASASMPVINRSKAALILEKQPDESIISNAMPQDLYTLRKELGDKLKLNTISPDELTNSAKSNRHLTSDIMSNVDDALNQSSGGLFDEYLKTHSEGMKPIEQGRAFKNIIDKFELKPRLLGTETPEITPYALRKAIDDNTWFNAGKKGYTSTVDDTARRKLDHSVDAMNALERAKKGIVSVTGSPTATYTASLMRAGLGQATGSAIPSYLINLAKALGESKGQRVLDDALLNPEKLQSVLDKYHKRNP